MGLFTPLAGFATIESSMSTVSADGTTVTASGTSHTKGSYSEVIASTARDSYGIMVQLSNVAQNATDTSLLVDIALGTTVLIPNLIAGGAPAWDTIGANHAYYFPLFIPASSQIQARCQSLISADTVNVSVFLCQRPIGPAVPWVGTRVTAYGPNTADSGGVAVTCGTDVYGTAATLDSSTDNPIRYLQIGVGIATTSLTTGYAMGSLRQGASTAIVDALPIHFDGAGERSQYVFANMLLAAMAFDFPAGIDLRMAMMHPTSNAIGIDLCAYGVD